MFQKGKGEDLKKIKQKADEAYAKSDWKKALEAYRLYADRTPFDARMIQRVGDLHRRLNQVGFAVKEYKRVASYYGKEGYWAKAIAMHKVVLELDPNDSDVQDQLKEMYSAQAPKKAQPIDLVDVSSGGEPAGENSYIFGNQIDLEATDTMNLTQTLGNPTHDKLRIPLFSEMNAEEFASVIEKLTIRKFPQDALVCEEGDIGSSMFVISEGIAEVFTKDVDGSRLVLARLTGGQFFGEYSLITQKERNASVTAKTDLEVMEITASDFSSIATLHPRIWKVLEFYLQKRMVHTIMSKSSVFHVLREDEREAISSLVQPKKFKTGDIIMKEGTDGDEMFFVKTGRVSITSERGLSKIAVKELSAGDFFGEMAMLSGKKRSATVQAVTDVEVFSLKRTDAAKVLRGNRDVLVLLQSKMKERTKETYETLESYKEAQTTLSLV